MLTTLRPRRVPNSTAPAASANRVSSPPRPTLEPGWKWVPRWRTMISPALTSWPPNRFTPSRWALESRPLREELAPFLCAMSSALPGLDAGHAQLRQALTVALTFAVAGLVLVLEDADLGTLDGADDLGRDGDLGERRSVRRHRLAVDEQDRRQRHRLAGGAGQALHLEYVADRDLVLLAAAADDRVHRDSLDLEEQVSTAR